MNSAATQPPLEPAQPSVDELWQLMVRASAEISVTRSLMQQVMAGRDDDNALILSESRLGVISERIDDLAAAVTIAGLMAPAAAPGPVAVPGPGRIPAQRVPGRRPLMTVVRP
jgi:hypothetical protein